MFLVVYQRCEKLRAIVLYPEKNRTKVLNALFKNHFEHPQNSALVWFVPRAFSASCCLLYGLLFQWAGMRLNLAGE
jgi:hypothetical protein